MKSTIFTEIIDETTIEVNESFDVTVDRLRQQQGICRETDSCSIPLEFLCNKKGQLSICNLSRHRKKHESNRMYCIMGEVITENDKTKVKIYSVKNKYYIAFSIVSVIIDIIIVSAYILAISNSYYEPSKKDIVIAILGILGIVYPMYLNNKEKSSKDNDLEIMKNEIVKRVNAIDKWND